MSRARTTRDLVATTERDLSAAAARSLADLSRRLRIVAERIDDPEAHLNSLGELQGSVIILDVQLGIIATLRQILRDAEGMP